MSHFTDTYEMVRQITQEGVDFFFVSFGEREIIKIVQYLYIGSFQGKELYNLGFGDYNYRAHQYFDDIVTNNGDPYNVYHTVLATIPNFFQIYEDATLIVRQRQYAKISGGLPYRLHPKMLIECMQKSA